jgi:hypothetical protein
MRYDRDEILARTDLPSLCEETLGPPKGRGRSATWPCPAPRHGPQTGKSPPVTVFTSRYGEQRWRCHACGAGGTAIDLVMVTQGLDFREAIEVLARRTGVSASTNPSELRRADIDRPKPLEPGQVRPELEQYVDACESWLWSPRGMPMRRWLRARGFDEPIMRANRLGADPGPAQLERAKGLPRAGAAIVLPVLGPDDRPVYLQARYLRPNGRRYDNPASDLVGSSPRFAEARVPQARRDDLIVVCEGMPDALTAAQVGYRAVGVLGAALPDDHLCHRLLSRYPSERLVVAFDQDDSGKAGAERLVSLLSDAGAADRVSRLDVPQRWGDLNGWLQGAWRSFDTDLAAGLSSALGGLDAATPTVGVPDMTFAAEPAPVGLEL